jgi:hypothetical protein
LDFSAEAIFLAIFEIVFYLKRGAMGAYCNKLQVKNKPKRAKKSESGKFQTSS